MYIFCVTIFSRSSPPDNIGEWHCSYNCKYTRWTLSVVCLDFEQLAGDRADDAAPGALHVGDDPIWVSCEVGVDERLAANGAYAVNVKKRKRPVSELSRWEISCNVVKRNLLVFGEDDGLFVELVLGELDLQVFAPSQGFLCPCHPTAMQRRPHRLLQEPVDLRHGPVLRNHPQDLKQ